MPRVTRSQVRKAEAEAVVVVADPVDGGHGQNRISSVRAKAAAFEVALKPISAAAPAIISAPLPSQPMSTFPATRSLRSSRKVTEPVEKIPIPQIQIEEVVIEEIHIQLGGGKETTPSAGAESDSDSNMAKRNKRQNKNKTKRPKATANTNSAAARPAPVSQDGPGRQTRAASRNGKAEESGQAVQAVQGSPSKCVKVLRVVDVSIKQSDNHSSISKEDVVPSAASGRAGRRTRQKAEEQTKGTDSEKPGSPKKEIARKASPARSSTPLSARQTKMEAVKSSDNKENSQEVPSAIQGKSDIAASASKAVEINGDKDKKSTSLQADVLPGKNQTPLSRLRTCSIEELGKTSRPSSPSKAAEKKSEAMTGVRDPARCVDRLTENPLSEGMAKSPSSPVSLFKKASVGPHKFQGTTDYSALKARCAIEPFKGPKKPTPIFNIQSPGSYGNDPTRSVEDLELSTLEPQAKINKAHQEKEKNATTDNSKPVSKGLSAKSPLRKATAPVMMTKAAKLRAEMTATTKEKASVEQRPASPQKPRATRKIIPQESDKKKGQAEVDKNKATSTTKSVPKTSRNVANAISKLEDTKNRDAKPSQVHKPTSPIKPSAPRIANTSKPTPTKSSQASTTTQNTPLKRKIIAARPPTVCSPFTFGRRSPTKDTEIAKSTKNQATAQAGEISSSTSKTKPSPSKVAISDLKKRTTYTPKPIAKSTKPLTKPIFELPGEARARELAERRAERIKKREEAEIEARKQAKPAKQVVAKASVGRFSVANAAKTSSTKSRPTIHQANENTPLKVPRENLSARATSRNSNRDEAKTQASPLDGGNIFPALKVTGEDIYPTLKNLVPCIEKNKPVPPPSPRQPVNDQLAERRKEERALASLRGMQAVQQWAAAKGRNLPTPAFSKT